MAPGSTSARARGVFKWTTLWVALAFVAGIAGVGLSFACWSHSSAAAGLWAAMLLLAAPALGVVGTPVESLRECAPATLADLFDRLDRTTLALKLVQGTRAALFIGNSFSAVLWFCERGGIIDARQFLVPYTFVCATSLILFLPWLASRERRSQEALASSCQALKEIKAGREWLNSYAERKTAQQIL